MTGRPGLHVVLVRPEIPWNAGNVGRTCLAAGARLHLVKPLGFSLESSAIRRAGLDYWPRVLPCLWPSWEVLEPVLTDLGTPWLFSAEAPRGLWEADLRPPAALVFGPESRGLPEGVRRRHRRRLVGIPVHHRRVRSLNLSTAVAVVLYEALRQQRAAAGAAPGG